MQFRWVRPVCARHPAVAHLYVCFSLFVSVAAHLRDQADMTVGLVSQDSRSSSVSSLASANSGAAALLSPPAAGTNTTPAHHPVTTIQVLTFNDALSMQTITTATRHESTGDDADSRASSPQPLGSSVAATDNWSVYADAAPSIVTQASNDVPIQHLGHSIDSSQSV
jgi:hypothetical protein